MAGIHDFADNLKSVMDLASVKENDPRVMISLAGGNVLVTTENTPSSETSGAKFNELSPLEGEANSGGTSSGGGGSGSSSSGSSGGTSGNGSAPSGGSTSGNGSTSSGGSDGPDSR